VIALGKIEFKPNAWHSIALKLHGSQITATVDNQEVTTIRDTTYAKGACGLMSGWNPAWYSQFSIVPVQE